MRKRLVPLLAIALLFAGCMGGGNSSSLNFYGLEYQPALSVEDFTLTDQNGENVSLSDFEGKVVVLSFTYTNCPDVCLVIESNMNAVKSQLGEAESDVVFISITMDPARDTPAHFLEWTSQMGYDWPHLTSEDDSTLMAVWDSWGIRFGASSHSHDEEDSSVTVVMPDGNTSENNVIQNGWTQLISTAASAGWDVNASDGQWGHMVSGFNGDNSPEDWSWWWELRSWNSTSEAWEESMVGIDDILAGHLAFAPNTTSNDNISAPVGDDASITIVQSNGTVLTSNMPEMNGWSQTVAALDDFDAPASSWGHYMSSIEGVSAPGDGSWWWELHFWNETSRSWQGSEVGMDLLTGKSHIAWAPNSTLDSQIPFPSGEQIVIHTKPPTYLIDKAGKKRVNFTDSDWSTAEVLADVQTLLTE